jgi:tetratricopeptide (TPR) repeat protein
LDSNNSDAYIVLSYLFIMKKNLNEAFTAAEKAISLNPNSADAYVQLGSTYYWSGRFTEAMGYVKKAIRLNPMPPGYYFLRLGSIYLALERYEEALDIYKKTVEIAPTYLYAYVHLAITYISMGRENEARAAALKVLNNDPDFSVNAFEKVIPFKDRERTKRFCGAARKAGLPD